MDTPKTKFQEVPHQDQAIISQSRVLHYNKELAEIILVGFIQRAHQYMVEKRDQTEIQIQASIAPSEEICTKLKTISVQVLNL